MMTPEETLRMIALNKKVQSQQYTSPIPSRSPSPSGSSSKKKSSNYKQFGNVAPPEPVGPPPSKPPKNQQGKTYVGTEPSGNKVYMP